MKNTKLLSKYSLLTKFKRVFLCILLIGSVLQAKGMDFYVATTGSDTNEGTLTAPFKTLSRAKSAVRDALPTATSGINVFVRGGTYQLSAALEFGILDSGSPTVPVNYSAYPGENVIISGAVTLSPTWTTYSGNIQMAAIGRGLNFDMLFVNNKLQVMARYPNYQADTIILNGYAADAISDVKVANWNDPSTGFIRGLHGSMWGGNSYKITGKSGSTITKTWVGDNNRGSGIHATYRMVENIFEELDAPGEWFYNKTTGKLFYYPPAGVNPSTSTFAGATIEELIRVVGTASQKVKYLTFNNFTFTGTHRTLFTRTYEPLLRSDWCVVRAGTIFIQDAENITISNSNFDRIGGNGIFISGYNRNHLITNNEFIENGASCVLAIGSKSALRNTNEWDNYITDVANMDLTAGPLTEDYPKDITISYNHMQDMGRFEKQTAGVCLSMAESITVSHNTIHGCPRAGLNVCDGCWGGHVFEYNDVFDCIRESGDHGPFNAWGRDRFYSIGGYNHNGSGGTTKRPYALLDAWKTTVIRNNRFHYDVPSQFGIDLDDGSSNYEIYNNLLLNTSVKLREGFDRKVYNNIMINRGPDLHVWYDACRDKLYNNIIVAASAYNPINVGSTAEEASTDYNLFYNNGDPVTISTFSWTAGKDLHSITANPQFVNPTALDYSVNSNSPALKLGFVNFPMDQFGKPGAPQPKPIDFISNLSANSDAEPLMGGAISSVYDMGIQSVLGAPDMNGVFFEVLPVGSYAALQGFKKDDLIREINGIPITTKQSFWLIYHSIQPGTTVSIKRIRNQTEEVASFTKMTASEMLNNTAGVIYTGAWANQVNTFSFNNDINSNQTSGSYFDLNFYGTGISFTSQKNADMGKVDVYIDSVLQQTINCYNATRMYQQTVFTVSGLSEGIHTLKAVNLEDKFQILDAFAVAYNTNPSSGTNFKITELSNDVLMYPSSVTDFLSIELKNSDAAMVELINYAGIKVLSKNINNGKNSIDLGGLSSGLYIVKIKDDYKLTNKKIIKL